MRVDEAVTSNSGIWYSLAAMVIVYTGMAVMATKVLRGMARRWREDDSIDLPTPYGPESDLVQVRRSAVSLADVCAALLFLGVVAYAILGGADFGSGVWDLLAGGARDGAHLRSQIDRSIGPVWEANHVWLIYVLVFLWTGFPTAFGAIMTTLFVPWLLVGLGHRPAGRCVRVPEVLLDAPGGAAARSVFAVSSVVTPFFLGMIAGAIASGRVPADGNGDVWRSWTGPTSWVGGTLAVLTVSFLAATFLAADAERGGRHDLADDIGDKALWSGHRRRRRFAGGGRRDRTRRRDARRGSARPRPPARRDLGDRRHGDARAAQAAELGLRTPDRRGRRRRRSSSGGVSPSTTGSSSTR